MELDLLWTIAQRELREALKNKWLWFYALAFAGLALALSQAGLASAGYAGLGGFGRTAASLINSRSLRFIIYALCTSDRLRSIERRTPTAEHRVWSRYVRCVRNDYQRSAVCGGNGDDGWQDVQVRRCRRDAYLSRQASRIASARVVCARLQLAKLDSWFERVLRCEQGD